MMPLSRAALPLAGRVSARRYNMYRSPFGPKYETQFNIRGITAGDATTYGTLAAVTGVAAGTFALFFFADVPRVRIDIIEKVPFLKPFFHKEIAPEDNPF